MIKHGYIFIFLFCILMVSLNAQYPGSDTTWNQTDDQGKKQGWWKKYYPDGTLMYKGYFKNDIPSGTFIRYFENGEKKALMCYDPGGIRVFSRLFYMNGKIAAEGNYTNARKDSVWRYYSYYSGTLSYVETYLDGRKNGQSAKYYSNGRVAEYLDWKSDMKHGKWLQFYEDSVLRLSAHFTMDELDGPYMTYNTQNQPVIKGQYLQGRLDGIWQYYDDDGQLEFELHYNNGTLLNEEVLEEKVMKLMDEIERNLGAIPEPDLDNMIPQQ